MGTLVDITLDSTDPARLQPALEAAYREMTRLSDMMNHYSPTSVVSAINMAAGIAPIPIPPELMQVLRMAQHVSEQSHGCFDITVASLRGWRFSGENPSMPTPQDVARQLPLVGYQHLHLDTRAQTAFLQHQGMRMDLGGIAKNYILDRGLQSLKRAGIKRAMINGGGDVLVMGGTADRPWRVGIRHPQQPEQLLGTLDLRDGIVASSGDYERFFIRDGRRYHHILDPKTGYPVLNGPHGVTLVSPNLAAINGWGAAIMVMGEAAGRRFVERTPGLKGLIQGPTQGLWLSEGLRDQIHLT